MEVEMTRPHGLSLTELLMSLFLSSLILILLMNQYSVLQKHYQTQELTIERSLDAQLIIDFIRDRVRQAGFTPCLNIERLISIDTRTNRHNLPAVIIQTEGAGFQVNHMKQRFGELLVPWTETQLQVVDSPPLNSQHPLLIADCFHAEVHRIKRVSPHENYQQLQLEKPLVYRYTSPVYIGEWQEEKFFVRRDRNTLFYQLAHVDAISNMIHDLFASILIHHEKRLLHLELQLDDYHTLSMDTLIRSI